MVLLRKKLLKYGTPKPSIFQPKTPKKASAMFQTHLWAARRQSLPKTNRAGGDPTMAFSGGPIHYFGSVLWPEGSADSELSTVRVEIRSWADGVH